MGKTPSQRRDHRLNQDVFYRMTKNGKMRARRDWGAANNFEFTKTEVIALFNKQGGRCYWTGVELVVDPNIRKHPLQPSLDRIDCSKPYLKDNVVVSACFINLGRGNTSKEIFLDSLNRIKMSLMER